MAAGDWVEADARGLIWTGRRRDKCNGKGEVLMDGWEDQVQQLPASSRVAVAGREVGRMPWSWLELAGWRPTLQRRPGPGSVLSGELQAP